MTATVAPERSLQQRMDALTAANRIRGYRAQLKQDMKTGTVKPSWIINRPPVECESMKVISFLEAVPTLGRARISKLLSHAQVSPVKTLGGLSRRQRDELLQVLVERGQ